MDIPAKTVGLFVLMFLILLFFCYDQYKSKQAYLEIIRKFDISKEEEIETEPVQI